MKRFIEIVNSKLVLWNLIVVLTILLIISCSSVFLHKNRKPPFVFSNLQNKIIHDQDASTKYLYTNPLLDCESFNEGVGSVVSDKELSQEVDLLKSKYDLDTLSVYFRDLNNGPWIGNGENNTFSPGSLLKTPYFISLLKYAEDDPGILDKKVLITKEDFDSVDKQNIKPSSQLEQGKEYSLKEIAERTVVYSDNAGFSALTKNIPEKYVNDVYDSIGNVYDYSDSEFKIRVKDAASFFRILYNSSYLNRNSSEYALKVLTQSDFKDGLVAGVSRNVKVAHKFGERQDSAFQVEAKDVIQVHDCGIIYYPNNPYILCVMTRGTDLNNQIKSIAETSRYFYTKISDEYKD